MLRQNGKWELTRTIRREVFSTVPHAWPAFARKWNLKRPAPRQCHESCSLSYWTDARGCAAAVTNRVRQDDEAAPFLEQHLDTDLGDDVSDPIHDLLLGERIHPDRDHLVIPLAGAGREVHLISDQCHRFRRIETKPERERAPSQPATRKTRSRSSSVGFKKVIRMRLLPSDSARIGPRVVVEQPSHGAPASAMQPLLCQLALIRVLVPGKNSTQSPITAQV